MAITRVFLSTESEKISEFRSHDNIAEGVPYSGKRIPANEGRQKREEPQATKITWRDLKNINGHPVKLPVILHQSLRITAGCSFISLIMKWA